MQGGGAAAAGDREGRIDRAREGLLELADGRPGGEEIATQHLGDGGDVVVVDRLPPIGQRALQRGGHGHAGQTFSSSARMAASSSQSALVSLA